MFLDVKSFNLKVFGSQTSKSKILTSWDMPRVLKALNSNFFDPKYRIQSC